jgi:hypothetical protein
MPPEDHPPETEPNEIAPNDEWQGPWGSIEPVPNSVETLCIQIEKEAGKPRIYFYPYRTLGQWNWSMGAPETLEIHVGGVHLTISGRGLRRLAEALNQGQLRLVQQGPTAATTGEIGIGSILMEDTKN